MWKTPSSVDNSVKMCKTSEICSKIRHTFTRLHRSFQRLPQGNVHKTAFLLSRCTWLLQQIHPTRKEVLDKWARRAYNSAIGNDEDGPVRLPFQRAAGWCKAAGQRTTATHPFRAEDANARGVSSVLRAAQRQCARIDRSYEVASGNSPWRNLSGTAECLFRLKASYLLWDGFFYSLPRQDLTTYQEV